MNPLVAVLIAQLSCQVEPMTFRDFYRSYYFAASPGNPWQGNRAEATADVVVRITNAIADFQDYRMAWLEKCK